MVGQLFREAGLKPLTIQLGEVQLESAPGDEQLEKLQRELLGFGFELLSDQKSRIIEKIKTIVIGYIQQPDGDAAPARGLVFSEYLVSLLHKDYSYLSKLFSEVEGLTIEKYLILQKIEKVKEWLAYDELSLSEMADRLGYSSVAHLSAQFKKTTGFTPSVFRKQKDHHRRPLDHLGRLKKD
jgi:AraC-like DNA-binding protein